ncbi:hypothetical protein ACT8ZV_03635 [Nocardioides sp. MAHUQ-72]|uniref:hypothetical protein n=1 Tax=unclassified Nocardioides TaxID=2615069 RepID=UPI003609773A
MRRALVIIVGAVVAALVPFSAARADSTVVVRGLGFSADSMTNLAIVGCADLFGIGGGSPTTYLSPSPGGPAGSRSLKFDLDGGTAVGSQHRVSSMAATTVAGLSVLAPQGTSGVAYAGYQSPEDAGTTLVWVGRAPLSVAAGPWRRLDAPALTYRWTKYDLASRQPVDSGAPTSSTVRAFMAAHGGDGAGFYALGLGCDGRPFKVDALRTGRAGDVTTYDIEGYTTATGISGSAMRISAGDALTINGHVSSDMIGPLAQGLLVLEAQSFGEQGFKPVDGAALEVSGGGTSATVSPTTHTVYRWRFGGSSSAEGSVSPVFTVDVAPVVTATPDVAAAKAGGQLAIVGTTTPARPGTRVTLWQVGPHGPVRMGTDTTDADGAYRVTVPRGETGGFRYFVTVPAGGGNLAGQSPTQSFAPLQ